MASYDFIINCYHQSYKIDVHAEMSVKEIIENICRQFNLTEDSFFLEIYDELISSYVDFNEDYQTNLRKQLPTLQRKTILGRITISGYHFDHEHIYSPDNCIDDTLSIDTSIQSIAFSIMDDEQQIDADDNISSKLIDFSESTESSAMNSSDQSNLPEYITFERDVIPFEKDYKSALRVGKDRLVKLIEGLKNSHEERFGYLLPEIKIPSSFTRKNRSKLLVAVVLQELNENQVQWRLHKFKGFLRNGTGTDSKPHNPFYIKMNQLETTDKDTYELPLRICSLRETESSKVDENIFHTLPKDEVYRRHLAEHICEVPRLVCVIVDEKKIIQWKTFGLSNFIRSIPTETSRVDDQQMDDAKSNISDITTDSTESTQTLFDNFMCTNTSKGSLTNPITIWVDSTIDFASSDYLNSFSQLQRCTNMLKIYTDPDQCIDFISDMNDKQVVLIMSGSLSQQIIPLIHKMPQLDLIYIFCQNESNYKQLTKNWSKVQGVFTEITYLCLSLKEKIEQNDSNTIPMTCISQIDISSRNLNELDSSFMYTQILKEILLEIDYNTQSYKELTEYFYQQYADDHHTLKYIDKFENEYHERSAIWWYTSCSFIYRLLNRSLRRLDIDATIKMGVFIRDLCNEIKDLHSNQIRDRSVEEFSIYRGQSLSMTTLEELKRNIGGLISFNNFLSTSVDRRVAEIFAEANQINSESIGFIFKIKLNSSIESTPFARISNQSYFADEEEILLSMHSIFRIDSINCNNSNMWEVELTLTNDNDPDLHAVTERLREETFPELKGWYRLGFLLTRMGQFDKAEKVYQSLLAENSNNIEKMNVYSQLGVINYAKGLYNPAIDFHNKALEIVELSPSIDRSFLATHYNNLAQAYLCINDYKNALNYCRKVSEIEENSTSIHPNLANSYIRMSSIYHNMADYTNAILFLEKALEIQQKLFPSNHPELALSYNNIGTVYEKIGRYAEALSFFEKSLEICLKTLPPDHPDLATSYRSVASIYVKRGQYCRALCYYEKSLAIQQRSLPSNHPDLASSYNDIGRVYKDMGDYLKALDFYMKAFNIQKQCLPSNHPDLASSYNNMGTIYSDIGDYVKALVHYQKALEIYQHSLPLNHPDLLTSYNNIGVTYFQMKKYSDALSCLEKAHAIRQQILPPSHPDLASLYNNIGTVYSDMHDYSTALSNYEKALEIYQKSLPSNHPSLSTSYNNIGVVYFQMGRYAEALLNYEKALKISQKFLPANHSDLSISYNNIGTVYENMNRYSEAHSLYEKAFEISKRSLPENHPLIVKCESNLNRIKQKL